MSCGACSQNKRSSPRIVVTIPSTYLSFTRQPSFSSDPRKHNTTQQRTRNTFVAFARHRNTIPLRTEFSRITIMTSPITQTVARGLHMLQGCRTKLPLVQRTRAAGCRLQTTGTRCLQQTAVRQQVQQSITVNFVTAAGDKIQVQGRIGDSLLDVALEHDVQLEGACGGIVACSSCHTYISEEFLSRMPEMEAEEEDMLDLLSEIRDNSRLGCQCFLDQSLDGLVAEIPAFQENLQ